MIENTEQQSLAEFSEQAYLNYSMYVILDRALPHIGDGLKPVQRRIIYAMSELGLKSTAKYKKSARTVGDVLGKFHPHGDTACYEAMVLMAQDFSCRYPLIDGQGNWGAADDPKSFAAMRYTESRLSRYAQVLLAELGQETVNWIPNFDGTLEEPKILPARLPNILLNGTTGIAVGMATDIPQHNLKEVAQACIHLLDHPNTTIEALCSIIPAPDFPTVAEIITPKADLLEIYRTGNGSVRTRAAYKEENDKLIITALPHQVSGAKIMAQIAQQMQAKKLPMITDLRDESDHENPTRIVIVPRSNQVNIDDLMSHLFATTNLERSYRVNLNVIGLDGRPQVKPLKNLLSEWLTYRLSTVTRRLQHHLDKVNERLHILDGLLIAFLNLDEVIQIIRNEDKPKAALIKRFNLSELQSETILEIRLRQLAQLEEEKLHAEQDKLIKEKTEIATILNSKAHLKTLVKKEIKQDIESFGDDRRSPLVERTEAAAIKTEALVPSYPVTIILSAKGWVRAAKGHDIDVKNLNYKSGDQYLASSQGKNNQLAIFLDQRGRAFSLPAHSLPSARSQGEPLTSRVKSVAGGFAGVTIGNAEDKVVLASDLGYGFITQHADLYSKNKSGKAILKMPEGGKPLSIVPIEDLQQNYLVAVSNVGRLLMFPVSELPELAKGKGNKIMAIPTTSYKVKEEWVIDITVIEPQQPLLIYSGNRKLTLSFKDLQNYAGKRGQRGNKLPRGYQKVNKITTAQ